MTDSERMQEEVYDYLDGLLSDQNRKAVQQKIENDPEYRSFYEDAIAVRNNLRHLRKLKTSDDFDTVLRARIKMERSLSRQRGFLGLPRMLPAYGAVAAVIALAFFMAPRLDEQPTPPTLSQESQSTQTPDSEQLPPLTQQPARNVNFPMDEVQKASANPRVSIPQNVVQQNPNRFLTDSTKTQRQFPGIEQKQQPKTQNVKFQEF